MKTKLAAILGLALVPMVHADDVVGAIHGVIERVDSAAGTVAVKTTDGAKYVLKDVKKSSVHGVDASVAASKDSFKGLEKGSEVVAHYSKRGGENVALEIDRVGKDGLDVTKGTVTQIDRGAKKIVVKTADGSEQAFDLTARSAEETGKGTARGTEKGAKVVVYSTEVAGKKIAHFFEGE